jgi:hypothetical protein
MVARGVRSRALRAHPSSDRLYSALVRYDDRDRGGEPLLRYLRARSSCSLSFCSAMNRLITVNSCTMLASTIMIAIAKKLMMLMTALLFSQHGKKAPAINGQGL